MLLLFDEVLTEFSGTECIYFLNNRLCNFIDNISIRLRFLEVTAWKTRDETIKSFTGIAEEMEDYCTRKVNSRIPKTRSRKWVLL